MKYHKFVRAVGLVVFLCVRMVWAQVTTGTISGTVKDSSGAVLPGVQVVLLNEDTGISRTVQSDAAGRYSAGSLSLGNYRVTATLAGFQTQVRSGIVLTVAREAVVDLELAVGAVTQTVEVAGEAPVIETTNATFSGLVNAEQIRELPLNGRSYADLATLSPGVLFNSYHDNSAAQGFAQRLSVNGSRADANLYLLDGTVVNDPAGDSSTAAGLSLGVEAIREFRILTHNFSAEYGRNSGAVVSAVTRSGTNELHGSVYEFVRNNIFDARDFFNVGSLPAFRRNQFGAAAGGPVKKDRIFFFANYEGLRQRLGTTQLIGVPDANARMGLLPDQTTGQLRPVPFNPVIAPYLALYPLPNGRSFGDGTAQYSVDISQPTTEDYAMERMDFRLSDKDNFYWRYVFDPSSQVVPRPTPVFQQEDGGTDHLVVLSETHIFSPTELNDFHFSFNRTYRDGQTSSVTPIDPSLSFIPGQDFGTIRYTGSLQATNVAIPELGNSRNRPTVSIQNLFQASDSFSLIRGAHSLKVGIDVERPDLNMTVGSNYRGVYQFSGLAALLAATPNQFLFSILGGQSTRERGWRRTMLGWFVQDDFRVTARLTLNLGLRHEFFTNASEVEGKSASLINVTDPQSTVGPPFITAKLNFAPRVGLAWDPTGSGKTSIRVGAGVYYNHVDAHTWASPASNDSQFFAGYALKGGTIAFPHGVPPVISAQSQATMTLQYQFATPTEVHYGLEIQRQLVPTMTLRLGYIGSYGYNMSHQVNWAVRRPTILPDGTEFFAPTNPFVNPNFSDIEQIRNDAHDNYNAFQAVLQKNVSAGLQFQASYTYSHALSESDANANRQVDNVPSTTTDVFNLARDYGRSGYDQRHTLVVNGQYRMPWDHLLSGKVERALLGGWTTNGIVQWGSGLPFNVGLGFGNAGNGDVNSPDRPNVLPGASNNPIHGVTAGCGGLLIPAGQKLRTPDRWFDPCAFGISTPGTFGNLARDSVQGPGIATVNFTLVKDTALAEKKQLEFRAEFFNLFNHPSFYLPVSSVFGSNGAYNGATGIITSTTSHGREIQLGMKLVF